jgi:hypothetical protein
MFQLAYILAKPNDKGTIEFRAEQDHTTSFNEICLNAAPKLLGSQFCYLCQSFG